MDLKQLGYDPAQLEDLGYDEKELDDLAQAYISQMTGTDAKEVEDVWKRPGTVYEGLREHERSEVAAHLLNGYSEGQILDGTAKEENHDRAHEAALLSEHRYYQQLGEEKIGVKDIPLKALMLVRPSNMTGEVLRHGGCLDDLQATREEIESQDVSGNDLFNAMSIFENPAYELGYTDSQLTFELAVGYLDDVDAEDFGEFEERPLIDIELPWGV